MKNLAAWFSLFASTGTLFCCALPSLLVALGMGASLAGLITTFPQLIWISQYKAAVFLGSGAMIGLSAFAQKQSQALVCPTDPVLAEACRKARNWSRPLLIFSAVIWSVGAFFAFVAPLWA